MKVQTILATKRTKIITIGPEQLIREAVALLGAHAIGALIVVAGGSDTPVGILSERDIVRRAVTDGEGVFSLTVAEVMSSPVITAIPQDDLFTVMHTMTERRIRHLPVMAGAHLVGVLSIGDVMKVQRDTYRGEATNLELQILADDPS